MSGKPKERMTARVARAALEGFRDDSKTPEYSLFSVALTYSIYVSGGKYSMISITW